MQGLFPFGFQGLGGVIINMQVLLSSLHNTCLNKVKQISLWQNIQSLYHCMCIMTVQKGVKV